MSKSTRKVIKQGNNALTITLPKEWADKYGITPGDDLAVEEHAAALIISPEGKKFSRKIRLDAKGLNGRMLEGSLVILYKAGYDEIDVVFDDTKTILAIQQIIKERLLGYEIIEQTHNTCQIKTISNALESEFDTVMRKVFIVTLSLAKNSLAMAKANKFSSLKELVALEETSDKFISLCHRVLIEKGYKDQSKTIFLYIVLWVMDRVGDRYRDICEYLSSRHNDSTGLSPKLLTFYASVNRLLEDFYDVFFDYNKEKMLKLAEVERYLKTAEEMITVAVGKEAAVLEYLIRILEAINGMYSSTIGLNS